jgi:hypothetical protein
MVEEEEEYKGREIRVDEETLDVHIDGEHFEAGRDAAGNYRLEDYAYDPKKSLIEVAERYVDYRERSGKDA